MMQKVTVAFVAVFAFAGTAFGQTVYKCKDANGNMVFSQTPCASATPMAETCLGADGKERAGACPKSRTNDYEQPVNPIAQGSPTPSETAPANTTGRTPSAVQDMMDSVDDADCRRDAKNRYVYPSTETINKANQEIQALENRVWITNGPRPSKFSTEMVQMDAQRIATLRQVLSSEQARNDSIRAESDHRLQSDLAECDRKKSEREAAHR